MKLFKKTYKKYKDEELMGLLIKGRADAFDELYTRYAARLYNYFYRMLYQDRIKAEDFTQDIFLKLIEKPRLFDCNRKFSTWIYTIAANMCKNEYRKNQVRSIMQPLRDEDPVDHFSPDLDLDSEVFKEALLMAVNELEDHHKECFILRYDQELPIREISEILGCPEGTVKSRIFYSLKKLKKSLKIFDPNPKKEKGYEKKIG